jgi:hypothetical protein
MDIFIDESDNKFIIDLDQLKKAERLEGATVFKRIFKIENPHFKEEEFPRDEEGNNILLKIYGISVYQWFEFANFIRNGRTKFDLVYQNLYNDKDVKKKFFENIDRISRTGVFIKFGPFPKFDEYLQSMLQLIETNEIETKKIYNPMTPEQDIQNKFIWDISVGTKDESWSVTIKIKDAINKYFYRKLKETNT